MFTHTYHSVTLEMIRLSHVCACVFKLRVSAHTTQIFDCPTGTNTHYAHMYVYILPSYTHTQLAAWAERSFVHSDSWHVVERIEER